MPRDGRTNRLETVSETRTPGARRRLSAMELARLTMSVLFVALGLVIVVQGIRLGTPWAYTLTGVLMAGLGAYRLRLAWALWAEPRAAAGQSSGSHGRRQRR